MVLKNESSKPKGFFAKASAVIAGALSPHPVSPESVQRSLAKSQERLNSSERTIVEHEKIQAACEQALRIKP